MFAKNPQVSVPSVSFSRDSTVYVPSVKFVVGPVLRFLYRPHFLFFNPPPCHKSSTPPADNARLCPDGGLCRPSCCNPFVDQVLRPKTHKGGWKTKNYSYGLWPGPDSKYNLSSHTQIKTYTLTNAHLCIIKPDPPLSSPHPAFVDKPHQTCYRTDLQSNPALS